MPHLEAVTTIFKRVRKTAKSFVIFACPHGTNRLSLDWFSLKLIFEGFSKIRRKKFEAGLQDSPCRLAYFTAWVAMFTSLTNALWMRPFWCVSGAIDIFTALPRQSLQKSLIMVLFDKTARMFGGKPNCPCECGCITDVPALSLASARGHWYCVPAHLLVYLLHTTEKAVWQHMPAYSLAFLMVSVRQLSYTGHCLLGCITYTFSGLPMPNSLYNERCFTLCASIFSAIQC